MSGVFISPDSLPQDGYGLAQVIFLGAVYGFILFNASNMISDGSELLLLIPSLAGIVGSVVLPVLGAVPDGAIVLFSGMGPDAQEQLSVGVGALAGSTIMLLTIPWALAVFAGRVNLDREGRGSYVRPRGVANWSKLYPAGNASLLHTGVVLFDEIPTNGKTMLLTSLTYLVLQIPAFEYTGTIGRDALANDSEVSAQEKPYALVAFVLSSLAFLGYLYWNIRRSSSSKVVTDAIDEVRVAKIRSGEISLSGVLAQELAEMRKSAASENTPLNVQAQLQRVEDLIRPFFHVYDKNKDNQMNAEELQLFFKDMGESMTRAELQKWIDQADTNKNGFIEFQELVEPTLKYLIAKFEAERHGKVVEMKKIHVEVPHMDLTAKPNSDDDEEEDETIPEDLAHLSIAEQQRRILVRSCYMMFVGTAVVLLFSDPMVDVLADVGKRTGIPSFYISFIFAPLASNASELIAAYNYALKKTSKSISISVSALLGAACMNNTLCLGIFAGLLYFKAGLVWKFSAETIAILAVEFIMGWFAMRKTQRLLDALLVLMIYPLSIALVYVLENIFDLD